MGENRWRTEDDWPPARAEEPVWHLRSGGLLTREPPGDEAPDEYGYDPNDPAPTIGGPTSLPARMMKANSGPLDQRRLTGRNDVLSYVSAPLDEAVEVTGPVELRLHAATSAVDTDFVSKVVDVREDGTATILLEGVTRMRFREGYDREVLGEPGRPYELRIHLGATSNVFLGGHRIGVLVTSS